MLRGRILSVFSVVFLLATFLVFSFSSALLAAVPQDEELPDVKMLTKELEVQYKKKKERDTDRIVAIYVLFSENYKEYKSNDQKKIVKAIRKGFDIKPPIEDREFLITGAGCLAGMGSEGLKGLQQAYEGRALTPKDKKDKRAARACLRTRAFIEEAMGQTKEPAAIKPIGDFLWNDNAEIIKAACKALANYNELPVSKRKPVVEELVKVYAYLDSQAQQAIKEPKFGYLRDRLIAVEGTFNQTLQKLTLQTLDSAPQWQKWYNKNKGKKKW